MTDLYSHGYDVEFSEDQWLDRMDEVDGVDWMQQETMDTAAADEASGRRADGDMPERCAGCQQTLAEVAESGFACPSCFFYFDHDALDDALAPPAAEEPRYTLAEIFAAFEYIHTDTDYSGRGTTTGKFMDDNAFTYGQKLVVDSVAADVRNFLEANR